MNNTKNWKAKVKYVLFLQMLKAAGKACLNSLRAICNDTLCEGKSAEKWILRSLVPVFKEKNNPLGLHLCKGTKLLKNALNMYGEVLDRRFHRLVDMNKMQPKLLPTKEVVNAVLRFAEKFRSKSKNFFRVFFHFKKLFDLVPREVVSFSFRWKCVPEYLV